jgi:hypothetical protein
MRPTADFDQVRDRVAAILTDDALTGPAKLDLLRIASILRGKSGGDSSASLQRLGAYLQSWTQAYDSATTRLRQDYREIRDQIDRERQAAATLRSAGPQPSSAQLPPDRPSPPSRRQPRHDRAVSGVPPAEPGLAAQLLRPA